MTDKGKERGNPFTGLFARTGAKRIHWVPPLNTERVRYENVEVYLGKIGKVERL